MKNLLIAVGLMIAATTAQASTMQCSSAGYSAKFIVQNGVLLDTNENVLADQIKPNVYQATDSIGTVTYTVKGKNITMKFDDVTKVYICQ